MANRARDLPPVMLANRDQYAEVCLAVGLYPQGVPLTEYVQRVPRAPKPAEYQRLNFGKLD